MPAGTALAREDIAVKRPGYGISVDQMEHLLGRRTARDIESDEVLQWSDLAT
jgi:sialic acid synthase SpsE